MLHVARWKAWACGGGAGAEGMDGPWEEGRRLRRAEDEDSAPGRSQTLRACPAQGLRATGLASYGMRGSWHGSPLPAVVLPCVLQTVLSPLALCQAWRRAVPYGVPSQCLRNQEASLVPKGVPRAWHPGPLQNGLWTHLEKEELLGLKPTPGGFLLLRSFWDPHPSRPFLCTLLPPPLRIFPPLRCSAWRWWG
uniref:Uncharacterized protein n=2 Tax=Macaca TaxID=9539 RepID=A0A1D5Q6Q1_MACMU